MDGLIRWPLQTSWGQVLCSSSLYPSPCLAQCLAHSMCSGNIYLGLRSAFLQWNFPALKKIDSVGNVKHWSYIFPKQYCVKFQTYSDIDRIIQRISGNHLDFTTNIFLYWLYSSLTYPFLPPFIYSLSFFFLKLQTSVCTSLLSTFSIIIINYSPIFVSYSFFLLR